jgi:predicted RecB family nuclease
VHSITGLHIYYFFGHLCELQLHRNVYEKRPEIREPNVLLILEQGRLNEARYVDQLRAAGREVVGIHGGSMEERAQRTLEAMRAGAEIIHNGVLDGGQRSLTLAERHAAGGLALRFRGESDLLVRVDEPSQFGAWSYRVIDVKSSRTGRLPQMMQVAYYDWLLEAVQGRSHERGSLVVFPLGADHPSAEEFFDLAALRPSLELFLEEQVDRILRRDRADLPFHLGRHCSRCLWQADCGARAKAEDEISLLPGVRRAVKRDLAAAGVQSLSQFMATTIELPRSTHLRAQAHAYATGTVRERIAVQDAWTDWFAERGFPPRGPQGMVPVYLDVQQDFMTGVEFGFAIQVGVHAPQWFGIDVGNPHAALQRLTDGLQRLFQRYGGQTLVLFDGGRLEQRLETALEAAADEASTRLLALLRMSMVDLSHILRRAYFLPITVLDSRSPVTILGADGDSLPAEAAASIPGAMEELAAAAEKFQITTAELLATADPELVFHRLAFERKHPVWSALIRAHQLHRIAALRNVYQRISAPAVPV